MIKKDGVQGARNAHPKLSRKNVREFIDNVDLSRLDDTFAFKVREIMRLFIQGITKDLRRFGITFGQWLFLRALWEKDGQYQQELCSILGMTSAAAVFSVNLLERDRLVTRQKDPADNRRYLVKLTPKGKALRRKLAPLARRHQKESLAGFSDRDILVLDDLLRRMKSNLQVSLKRASARSLAQA